MAKPGYCSIHLLSNAHFIEIPSKRSIGVTGMSVRRVSLASGRTYAYTVHPYIIKDIF
jgi:hypothetical protein